MKFEASINIMPQKALLDPQGKAVTGSMKNIGLEMIQSVRIGKHITFELDANDQDHAKLLVSQACEKLLVNPIMESFEFTLKVL
jgi:phosphoribosylformylglycinamidine synthase